MVPVRARLSACLPSLADVAFIMPILFLFGRMEGAHTLLIDGDTGWHIRAGEWILRHGRAPRQDLFSFTRPGAAWFAWEWLSEAAMAWLHRWGMAAVVLAATILLCISFALLYRIVRARSGNPLIAIAFTGMAVAGSSIHWLARPHLVTFLFTVVVVGLLESRGTWRLWLIPPLVALWTNLHAGFVFGIVLVAVYALEDRARARSRTLAALASLVASLLNPYGWRLDAHIARYLAADSWQFDHIREFLSPNFHAPLALCFELMLGLAAVSAAWHCGRKRFHYCVLAALTAHMALVSARNIPLFLLASAAPVALAVAEWTKWAARRLPRARRLLSGFLRLAADLAAVERRARIPAASAVAAVLLGAVLLAPAAGGKFRSEFDPKIFPAHALEQVRTPNARIFSSDQWSDYLIYRLYPEVQVFVDGRSDFYGAAHEQLCQDVWNVRYDWQQQLARFGVDTMLVPADTPLAGALKQSGRWRVAYDDGLAIVFRAAGDEPVSGLAANRLPEYPQSNLRSEPK